MNAKAIFPVQSIAQIGSLLSIILGLPACSSVPQGVVEPTTGPRKLVIQPETRWPTSAAWWNNPNATALVSANPYQDNAARMDSDAKVATVKKEGSKSSTIVFRPIGSSSITIALHGPSRLADFLSVGQHVNLVFDRSGNITQVGDMPELKSWTRAGERHRIDLTTQGGKSYTLFAGDRQLFYGVGDIPSERSETHLAQQYDEWTSAQSRKRYSDLSHTEKVNYLRDRVEFEVILTPRGATFFTGSGYGGGAETEPEWILPQSASEGF